MTRYCLLTAVLLLGARPLAQAQAPDTTRCPPEQGAALTPPLPVQQWFVRYFPTARHLRWTRTSEGWAADFLNGPYKASAVFYLTGELARSERGAPPEALPAWIREHLAKYYPSKPIHGVIRREDANTVKVTWEMAVAGQTLHFDDVAPLSPGKAAAVGRSRSARK